MKFKNVSGATLLFLITVSLLGCSDKDHREPFDFRMGAESYEVRVGMKASFSIVSGNGDYTIQVEDDNIIEAGHLQNGNLTFGSIDVTGKEKGETTLSITDKATQQTVKVKVKVTDFYLPLVVSTSNHPALVRYMRIFLVNNDNRDAYFFLEENNVLNLQQKGRYEIVTERKGDVVTPYLLLRYASDNEGKFTDAAIVHTVHKFDLTGSDQEVYKLLSSKFGVDWGKPSDMQTKSSPISLIYLNLKEVGTEYDVKTYVGYSSWQDYIPEGHLD